MTPESADTLVTALLSIGLVLSGIAAIAALPWRRSELDGAHRAALSIGHLALRALVLPPHPSPALAGPAPIHSLRVAR